MQGGTIRSDGIHHVKGQVTLVGNNEFDIIWDSSYKKFNIYKNGLNVKIFGNVLSNYIINESQENLYISSSNSNNYIWIFDKDYYFNQSVSDLKTWLSTHNLLVEYELATPDKTNFTPEQQAVYDEIISDGTYYPVTHISAEASINPDMDMEYYQDLKLWVNSLINSSN